MIKIIITNEENEYRKVSGWIWCADDVDYSWEFFLFFRWVKSSPYNWIVNKNCKNAKSWVSCLFYVIQLFLNAPIHHVNVNRNEQLMKMFEYAHKTRPGRNRDIHRISNITTINISRYLKIQVPHMGELDNADQSN